LAISKAVAQGSPWFLDERRRTMDTAIPYCVLRPNLGSGSIVKLSRFEELLAQIEIMTSEHEDYVAKYRHEWPERCQTMVVGFSFYLTNRSQGVGLVGVCGKGWTIYQMEPKPIKRLKGNLPGDSIIAILLPDWSEFPERELLVADHAKAILRRWLDGSSAEISE
jgi:hypothetical protein